MKTKVFLVSTLVLPFFLVATILVSRNLLGGDACNGTAPNGQAKSCTLIPGTAGCSQWTTGCSGRVGVYSIGGLTPGAVISVASNGCVAAVPGISHCVITKTLCGYNHKCIDGNPNQPCGKGSLVIDLFSNPFLVYFSKLVLCNFCEVAIIGFG
ncbi:MAG: hypothetical protein LBJ67_10770 [Planctomycetaceae bacterium]|jgi:hypothetical protein|nr:hypothetical protein [Planctomycetaceae bacterium]